MLIDAAHKMRYATKYCSKSKVHSELVDEVDNYLSSRAKDVLPPNINETLTSLVLADSLHRSFMSKQEFAYRVAQLPEVRKSHSNIGIVGLTSSRAWPTRRRSSSPIEPSIQPMPNAAQRTRFASVSIGASSMTCVLREFAEYQVHLENEEGRVSPADTSDYYGKEV